MTYCKISLKTVPKASKYRDYQDAAFKSLFGSLKVNPVLELSRPAFKQASVRHTTGLSISGVQQKLSLGITESHQLEPVTTNGQYILKPSPEEFPNAAENEHTAMLTGHILGIRTADCGLISFADDELAYITRRFDRPDNVKKFHQEDLVQGFDMPSDRKYDKSYEAAGALINAMTGGKQTVVLEYIHRIMHAYLVGNDDMHLKNTSLQKLPNNTTALYDQLTPNYDCLFAGAFENRNEVGFLALDLLDNGFSAQYEHHGYYTGHDFVELAGKLGIPAKPIQSFVKNIERKLPQLIDMIHHSYMRDEQKVRAGEIIVDRLRTLSIGV